MSLDFSGAWILNRLASKLTEGAAAVESGVLWIDQDGPKCKFRIQMTAGGESNEKVWEGSLTEPADAAAGGFWSRLLMDGDTLVFDCGSDGSWTMSWRYDLTDAGKGLRAVEQMSSEARNFENIWIFDRASSGKKT